MTVRLSIQVKPAARNPGLQCLPDGTWLARLAAPPVDGRANDELLGLVARHFGRPRSAVRLLLGSASRRKLVAIEGVDEAPGPPAPLNRHPRAPAAARKGALRRQPCHR